MTTPPQNPLRPLLQPGIVFESTALDPALQPLLTPLGAKAQGPISALDALLSGQTPEFLKFPGGFPFPPFPWPPPTPSLTILTLAPSSLSIGIGEMRHLTLSGIYSDGSVKDVTNLPQVAWSSSDLSVVEVAPGGIVTGLDEGMAVIAAVIGPIEAFADVTVLGVLPPPGVTLVSLEVTPEAGSLDEGETQQLTATGLYSDGSTRDLTSDPDIEWMSSSSAVAVVSSSGLLTAIMAGNVTISAHYAEIDNDSAWTITAVPPPPPDDPPPPPPTHLTELTVSPASFSLRVGTSQQLSAMGRYNDGSDRDLSSQVAWSSANHLVATVSTRGLVSGLATGAVLITASLSGLRDSSTATVLAVPPPDEVTEMEVRETYQGNTLWRFQFSKTPVATLPFAPRDADRYDFKAGFVRWNDDGQAPDNEAGQIGADQIGNDALYIWYQHRDTGGKFRNAIRFFWQVAGRNDAQLDTAGMKKAPFGSISLLSPYPQELGAPFAVDKSHPGARILARHKRIKTDGTLSGTQELQHITIPPRDPANSRLHWYYQNTGEFIAFHDDLGVVGILTISGARPDYGYRVEEL